VQDLRQKIHGQLELPKNPRYGVAALLFLCYLEFFASPQSYLCEMREWLVLVGGWYICSDFYACPFPYSQKFLEFHSSVFSFSVEINAHVNQTSILVAHVQG